MSFFSWLRNRTSIPSQRARAQRRPAAPRYRNRPRPSSFRPRLEVLEDRCLLSGGVLDPTFGSGGLLTTSVGATTVNSQAYAVASYPNAGTANDGKVVAAGYTLSNGDKFAVVRYNLDGALDPSFGGSGEVTGPGGVANDVKIQPDGKIVVAGWSAGFAVARYNADGSPDSTFGGKGSKGLVVTPIGKRSLDGAGRLALQPDGKIVVAGWTAAAGSSNYDLVLARYNADGSLDATFGAGGKVIQHFAYSLSQSNQVTGLIDMALDAGTGPLDPNAGKIVVVAPLQYPGSSEVVRFNTNGSLDASFGGAGYVASPGAVPAIAVAVQSDDRIVLGGGGGGGIGLARLNPDGTLDATFGSGGVEVTPLPGRAIRSVAIQPDGKIVVAGTRDYNFMVARYNGVDGSLDASFGVNGIAVSGNFQEPGGHPSGFVIAFAPGDVALEPDGRIVEVGTLSNYVDGHYHFALARFLATGPQIGSFTASPDPATAGGDVTLTAANVAALNPGSTVAQVAFYQDSNGDGVLDAGDALLGYGSRTSTGAWTLSLSTSGLTSGTYTFFAQAEDSYGVFGDPLALRVTLI